MFIAMEYTHVAIQLMHVYLFQIYVCIAIAIYVFSKLRIAITCVATYTRLIN